MLSWAGRHFDVIAATWLIILVFAWSILLAAASASHPADWSKPLIGSVDWNALIASPPPPADRQVSPEP